MLPTMSSFPQILLDSLIAGCATGCVYGLVALSFVLIYKATSAVSFMQGELLMLGAFIVLAFHHAAGWPLPLALLGSIICMGLLGAGLERTLLHQALGQPHLTAVLLTFGCGLILRGAVLAVPEANQTLYPFPLPELQANKIFYLGKTILPAPHLYVMLATLLVTACLYILFHHTRIGLGLRACAENPHAASLCGVPIRSMHTLAWALGSALAAIAGILLAPLTFVHLDMGLIALKAFPAAVLGGLVSLPGALAGGLIIGLAETLCGLFLPEGFKDIVPYLILLATLLLFPQGIMRQKNVHS